MRPVFVLVAYMLASSVLSIEDSQSELAVSSLLRHHRIADTTEAKDSSSSQGFAELDENVEALSGVEETLDEELEHSDKLYNNSEHGDKIYRALTKKLTKPKKNKTKKVECSTNLSSDASDAPSCGLVIGGTYLDVCMNCYITPAPIGTMTCECRTASSEQFQITTIFFEECDTNWEMHVDDLGELSCDVVAE